jgi:hypothetical protein
MPFVYLKQLRRMEYGSRQSCLSAKKGCCNLHQNLILLDMLLWCRNAQKGCLACAGLAGALAVYALQPCLQGFTHHKCGDGILPITLEHDRMRWCSSAWLEFLTEKLGNTEQVACSLDSRFSEGAADVAEARTSYLCRLLLCTATSVAMQHSARPMVSGTGLVIGSCPLLAVAAQCKELIQEATSDAAPRACVLPVACLFDCLALCATSSAADVLCVEMCDVVVESIATLCSCPALPASFRTRLPVCMSTLAWALSGASSDMLAAMLPCLLAQLGPPDGSDGANHLALQLLQPNLASSVLGAAQRSLSVASPVACIAWAWIQHAACTAGVLSGFVCHVVKMVVDVDAFRRTRVHIWLHCQFSPLSCS